MTNGALLDPSNLGSMACAKPKKIRPIRLDGLLGVRDRIGKPILSRLSFAWGRAHSADLARLAFAVPSDASDPSCMAFARATTLAASKATSEERTDEASLLFQLAERVKALLLRALTMTTASASTLASAFVETVNSVHLPACYAMVTVSPMHACAELLAAHAFGHGTAAEVRTVEQARILRVGRVHKALGKVLDGVGSRKFHRTKPTEAGGH